MRRPLRTTAGVVAGAVVLMATAVSTGGFRSDDASAAPAAATACPPSSFVSTTNYAKNHSFETVGPNGSPTTWSQGMPTPAPSAAARWFMHSNNQGATVTSELVATTVPGPGGSQMLRFVAGGQEGGVYQRLRNGPSKLMFSVWVLVRRGQVAVQANGGASGPVSWSTKKGEWEQLRVCTDGTVPTDTLVVYNQDPQGGEFYVDRAEARETP